MPRVRTPVSEKEQQFHTALNEYRQTASSQAWDTMFYCVRDCCEAVCRRLLGSVKTLDFDGKVLDATCAVMNRLKRNNPGDTPRGKLSTFVFCYCRKALYNPKVVAEERQILYSDFEV